MTQTFRHAIVACHPELKSFTLSVANRYAHVVREYGHEVVLRDLYRMRFDPILKAQERRGVPAADVTREWDLLGKPDVFVLVYPIWFGTPPTLLNGYIDRVFGAGRSLGVRDSSALGERLAGTRLVSLSSSGRPRAWLDEKGVLGSLRTVYDRYLLDVFGFAETHRHHFDAVTPESSGPEIEGHLLQIEKAAGELVNRMVGGPPDRHPSRR